MGRFIYYITTDGANIPKPNPMDAFMGMQGMPGTPPSPPVSEETEAPGRMYLGPDANGWERYRVDAMGFGTEEEATKYAFEMVSKDKELFAKVGVEKLWYEPPDILFECGSVVRSPLFQDKEAEFRKQMEMQGLMLPEKDVYAGGLVRGGPDRDPYTMPLPSGDSDDFEGSGNIAEV